MPGDESGGIHPVAMEDKIAGFVKWNRMRSRQIELTRCADFRNGGHDSRGIDLRRFMTGEAQEHGPICCVPHPGQRQRSVKLCLHARDPAEQPARAQLPRKAARGLHRPHGMRARWADADFVQIEETRGHGCDCSGKLGLGVRDERSGSHSLSFPIPSSLLLIPFGHAL